MAACPTPEKRRYATRDAAPDRYHRQRPPPHVEPRPSPKEEPVTDLEPVPSDDQLLILVDRADRGLTPAEQAVLRAGLGRLAAARRERDEARATVAAVRELAGHLGGPWHGSLMRVIDAPDPVAALGAVRAGYLPPSTPKGRAA